MRKARHLLATLVTTAALGLALPLPSAHAAGSAATGAGCDAEYFKYKGDGKVRAYHETDCRVLLGADAGDDPNWGDGAGQFQGGDNDNAFSVLNTGTYSGGYDVVAFYVSTDYDWQRGGYSCLKRSEIYVDDLARNDSTGGYPMWYNISSHRWVTESACAKFMS
ncbi:MULTISPECIES: hypothetical protein [unclassified Streptomyces]|uniref:hypothetical protein n=1 Tax=unclassified Streptomyces TaxID=2593676 RepID=UPI0036EE2B5A